MTSKIQIVAIEGVDGVGKSTLAKILAEGLNSNDIAVAKTPFRECNDLALLAKSEGELASFCGYLIGNICIQKQFQASKVLILDRYILSTLVYHHRVISNIRDQVFSILELANIVKPTVTILLNAKQPIIENRLKQRKEASKSKRSLSELEDLFRKYICDPQFKPWLGKLIDIRSEDLQDQQRALKRVANILSIK